MVDGKVSKMPIQGEKLVFVTVGTTSFDALVRSADSLSCRRVLVSLGFSSILFQIGRGSYVPEKSNGADGSLKVDWFRFSPNLKAHISSASLVLSHAGSGSIFETLQAGRPLVVVVNEDLMDNHQMELAEELAEKKFLFCASPGTLEETLRSMDLNKLVQYPSATPQAAVEALENFLQFDN